LERALAISANDAAPKLALSANGIIMKGPNGRATNFSM